VEPYIVFTINNFVPGNITFLLPRNAFHMQFGAQHPASFDIIGTLTPNFIWINAKPPKKT